eukprot:TRINITY_DN1114_c0_g1_i1.p1 TRINITY_DN1114_c0_g1~~TRINITY_DN1114_c0_g1_i1.p1  ORF type:complete len:833 (+),score=228.42 TRINITY_DN1114_c0_g1_i1:90-2588(+)
MLLRLLFSALSLAGGGAGHQFKAALAGQTAQWQAIATGFKTEADKAAADAAHPSARVEAAVCVMETAYGDFLYVHGGEGDDRLYDDLWRLDFATLEWQQMRNATARPRERKEHYLSCDGARGAAGEVYLFLGEWEGKNAGGWKWEYDFKDGWVYDVAAGTWTELDSQQYCLDEEAPYTPPARAGGGAPACDLGAITSTQHNSDAMCASTPDLIVCAGGEGAEKWVAFNKSAKAWLPPGRDELVTPEAPGGFAVGSVVYMVGGEEDDHTINRTVHLDTAGLAAGAPAGEAKWVSNHVPGLEGSDHKVVYTQGADLALLIDEDTAVTTYRVADQTWVAVSQGSEWLPADHGLKDMLAVGYAGALVMFGGKVAAEDAEAGNKRLYIYNPTVCPLRCSGRGTCDRGNCIACSGGYAGVACEVPPRSPPAADRVTPAVVAVALACVAAAAGAFVLHTRARARKVRFAPKGSAGNGSAHAAFVFTDIFNSTRLWNDAPVAMEEAIVLHHKLARGLLERYEGYEVKTIGDAFFAAFKDDWNAVQFCCAFQSSLNHAAWPDAVLAHEHAAPLPGLRGLRVRCGVHSGVVQVVRTPMGGYDYDGHAVNLAARVSDAGCGGQVIVTSDVYTRIAGSLDQEFVVEFLGEYRFSGIPVPEGIVQVMPASLEERTFAALRKADRVDDGKESSSVSSVVPLQHVHDAHKRLLLRCHQHGGLPARALAALCVAAAQENPDLAQPLFYGLASLRGDGGSEDRAILMDGFAESAVPETVLSWRRVYEFSSLIPAAVLVSLVTHLDADKDATHTTPTPGSAPLARDDVQGASGAGVEDVFRQTSFGTESV